MNAKHRLPREAATRHAFRPRATNLMPSRAEPAASDQVGDEAGPLVGEVLGDLAGDHRAVPELPRLRVSLAGVTGRDLRDGSVEDLDPLLYPLEEAQNFARRRGVSSRGPGTDPRRTGVHPRRGGADSWS